MTTAGTNLLLLTISVFWSSSRWMSTRRQRSILLGGRYRQVALYTNCNVTPIRRHTVKYNTKSSGIHKFSIKKSSHLLVCCTEIVMLAESIWIIKQGYARVVRFIIILIKLAWLYFKDDTYNACLRTKYWLDTRIFSYTLRSGQYIRYSRKQNFDCSWWLDFIHIHRKFVQIFPLGLWSICKGTSSVNRSRIDLVSKHLPASSNENLPCYLSAGVDTANSYTTSREYRRE